MGLRSAALAVALHLASAADAPKTDTRLFPVTPAAVTPLGEGWGWFVVLVFGVFFTVLTILFSAFEMKKLGTAMTSEHFNTASRNVGAGLTAAVLVSQWTWSATLLLSPDSAWRFGLSGPYWYAAAGTVQILFFGVLAVQVKRRASHLHTFMEFAKARFGTAVHCVMIVFGLLANMLVTALLLLGGAVAVKDLTGMSAVWVSFLIPLFACLLCTLYGGLRSSFIARYFHGAIVAILLLAFLFTSFGSRSHSESLMGNANAVYDGLEQASVQAFFRATKREAFLNFALPYPNLKAFMENDGVCYSSAGANTGKACLFQKRAETAWCCNGKPALKKETYCRADGSADCLDIGDFDHYESQGCDLAAGEKCVASYVTMGSSHGLLFGIACIFGNFGKVVMDQSFWQSAIAVKPRWTALGFLAGGLLWFAVPFALGSAHGLVGRALSTHYDGGPKFVTMEESEAGFGPARVVSYVIGSGGAFLLLLQLFACMCSTASAEIMAVASVLTYDVYFEYIYPELKQARLMKQRHFFREATAFEQEDKRIPTERINPLMDVLMQGGFFKEVIPQDELCRLAKSINSFTESHSVATMDLYCCVNRSLSITNPEGAVLLRMSRFFACCFAFLMGFLALWLEACGFGLGWVYMAMGIVLSGAVGPVCVAVLLQTANGLFVAFGALFGTVLGVLTWMLRALVEHDGLTYETLGHESPLIAGSMAALLSGLLIALVGSLLMPDVDFEWETLDSAIPLVDDILPPREASESSGKMDSQFGFAVAAAALLSIVLLVMVPLPLYGAAGVFSKAGFTAWIVLVCFWALVTALLVVFWPPLELFLGLRKAAKVEGKQSMALTNGEDLMALGPYSKVDAVPMFL